MNQKQILEDKIKQSIRDFEEATGTDIVRLNLEINSVGVMNDNGLFYSKQIMLDIRL